MRSVALLLALALLGGGCGPSRGQHARVVERAENLRGGRFVLKSELRPGRATLGDVVEWRLSADVPGRAPLGRIIEAPADSTLDVIDLSGSRGPYRSSRGGRDVWVWSRRIQGFALGAIPLPAAALVAGRPTGADTISFPPDTLFVDSLTTALRDSVDADRAAIGPGLRPVDRAVAVAGVALVLGLLAAAVWLWRRLRKRHPGEAAAPPEPPAATFLRELDQLRADVDRLARDVFYDRLSASVRRYLEAETGIEALERTTREIESELERAARGDESARRAAARVLRRADLAKFARAEDERAAALAAVEEARGLSARFPPPSAKPAGDAGGAGEKGEG